MEISLEGFLQLSVSDYVIIVDAEGRAIEIDDTLLRSSLIGKQVVLIVKEKR